MDVDAEKAILRLIKVREILIARCLGQLSVEAVRPAVVLAGENVGFARLARDKGERPMTADVVEGIDCASAVFADDELVVGHLVLDPLSRLDQARLVRGQEPLPREDGPALQIIHGLGCVEGSWERSHRGTRVRGRAPALAIEGIFEQ